MEKQVLDVKNLTIQYKTDLETVYAVNDVSFSLNAGETLGLVGETGAGKTTTALGIMGLLPERTARIPEGTVTFEGRNLLTLSDQEMQKVRGSSISMIFQDPMTALNPVLPVGKQIGEALYLHNEKNLSQKEIEAKVEETLELVGIPKERKVEYPYQFSGGMRQRVVIAIALVCNPALLIADEPTTALDVTIQAQILHLLLDLQKQTGMSIILITHDLGVVAQTCRKVAVMCGGYVVESGTVEEIFLEPAHPYTKALIASMPKVGGGAFEQFLERDLSEHSEMLCPFLNRCKYAEASCESSLPAYREITPGHLVRCHLCRTEIKGKEHSHE